MCDDAARRGPTSAHKHQTNANIAPLRLCISRPHRANAHMKYSQHTPKILFGDTRKIQNKYALNILKYFEY